jgi:uncharacterized protein involved in exopolysaccharide biosynthesis
MDNIPADADPDVLDYLRIVVKRRRTVFLTAALAFSLMAAYAFLSAPVFRATAVIGVDKVRNDVAAPAGEKQAEDSDEGYFETQFKLVAGDTQLRRVYNELKLADVPEFARGLDALRNAVAVTPVPHSRLCTVDAESRDPKLAAEIAGALARAFVRKNLDNQLLMSKTELGALHARARQGDERSLAESLPAVVNNKLIQDIKTQIFNAEAALAD